MLLRGLRKRRPARQERQRGHVPRANSLLAESISETRRCRDAYEGSVGRVHRRGARTPPSTEQRSLAATRPHPASKEHQERKGAQGAAQHSEDAATARMP